MNNLYWEACDTCVMLRMGISCSAPHLVQTNMSVSSTMREIFLFLRKNIRSPSDLAPSWDCLLTEVTSPMIASRERENDRGTVQARFPQPNAHHDIIGLSDCDMTPRVHLVLVQLDRHRRRRRRRQSLSLRLW